MTKEKAWKEWVGKPPLELKPDEPLMETAFKDGFDAGYKAGRQSLWTPVGERLPDRTDGFEVTILAQCGTRSIRNSMFVMEKQVWYNAMPASETVIAWREKPRPFQENL